MLEVIICDHPIKYWKPRQQEVYAAFANYYRTTFVGAFYDETIRVGVDICEVRYVRGAWEATTMMYYAESDSGAGPFWRKDVSRLKNSQVAAYLTLDLSLLGVSVVTDDGSAGKVVSCVVVGREMCYRIEWHGTDLVSLSPAEFVRENKI